MALLKNVHFLLQISRSRGIVRRYFVVNGFDGALTMLGIITGFYISDPDDLQLVIGACLGAAIALGVSGLSSAYISEVAERRKDLSELESAMIADLSESAHGRAARWVPVLIAAVNGLAPLVIAILIVAPIIAAHAGVALPLSPFIAAMLVAVIVIFLLGVFLGQVGRSFWLLSGIQTVVIALCTMGLIVMLG